MDKQTIEEYRYLKDWIEKHPQEKGFEKYDGIMGFIMDPLGQERENFAIEVNRIEKELAKEERLDNAYLSMAEALAQLSYAERAKVGCLIVKNGQIVSQGYNGTPSGFDNCCEDVMSDGEHSCMRTRPEVLHAESNAISKCAKWGGSTDGATLYVTMSPCFECAKLIIQAGIRRVVYKEKYRDTEGLALLKKAGIELNHYINGKQEIVV